MSPRMIYYKVFAVLMAVFFGVPFLTSACTADDVPGTGAQMISDVLIGHNNMGPYMLTWTNIDAGSVRVILDGRTLKQGDDYGLDQVNGIMSFTASVPTDAIVHVSYNTTALVQACSGQVSIPVSVDLLQDQDTSLKVTGLYAQNDPKDPNSSKMVIGLGGDQKWSSSSITTQFMLSQSSSSNANAQQGNPLDNAAMKVGGNTQLGALKLSGSFTDGGIDFAGAKEMGVDAGSSRPICRCVLPNKMLQASATHTSTLGTGGAAAGTSTVADQQSVIVAPTDTTKLSLVHLTNETNTAILSYRHFSGVERRESDSEIGTSASAAISMQDTTTTTGNTTAQQQTVGVGISAKPVDQVKLDAKYGSVDNDSVGHQTSQNANIVLAPGQGRVDQRFIFRKVDSTKLG